MPVLLSLPLCWVIAQSIPDDVRRERAEFARWLDEAPTSPYRALAQVSVGRGVILGPAAADVPLPGVEPTRLEERGGTVWAVAGGAERPLPRDRALPLGSHRLVAAGLPGRSVVTVYGPTRRAHPAATHYRYRPELRFAVVLDPTRSPSAQRLLAPDGTETEATEAGTVTFRIEGRSVRLRVYRIPSPGGEESELEIYFQDPTNSRGSYPAGRFVNLLPAADGGYTLDLNRARNAFCAYNTVFPCPAPWRGNRIPVPVEAGEKYPPAATAASPG